MGNFVLLHIIHSTSIFNVETVIMRPLLKEINNLVENTDTENDMEYTRGNAYLKLFLTD